MTSKKPAAKPTKAAKGEAKEIPPFVLSNGKSLGARALANAAERFGAATTNEAWQEACGKISSSGHETAKLLVHLMECGLFAPTNRLQVAALASPLAMAAPELALSVLSKLDEALVETVRTAIPPMRVYTPVLSRLHRLAPEAFRKAVFPPTFARIALMIRALAGESLDAAEGAQAVAAISELLVYGHEAIQLVDEAGKQATVAPEVLGAALARIGGPRWIRTFPNPDTLPAAVATPALQDEPLEEVARALSLFNKAILDARTEPPARFFEVAKTLHEQNASFMRAAGIRRAAHPDEIPEDGEHLLKPQDVLDDAGFAKLGTKRLDAWAERWLERYPNALKETDPMQAAFGIGISLRRVVLLGIPFSLPLQRRIIGTPQPYKHDQEKFDVRSYFQETSYFRPAAARALLPVLAGMAREHEGDEAKGLRLALAAAVRNLPKGDVAPEEMDELLSLGDAFDYDTQRAVREAVVSLPIERGERIVARTAHALEDPFDELSYAREGASDVAMRRYARLVASGKNN